MIVLLPLLGLTWVFGLFAVDKNTVVFAWLFTVFNSLQVLFVCTHYMQYTPRYTIFTSLGSVHIHLPCAQEQKGGFELSPEVQTQLMCTLTGLGED